MESLWDWNFDDDETLRKGFCRIDGGQKGDLRRVNVTGKRREANKLGLDEIERDPMKDRDLDIKGRPINYAD